MKKISLIKVSSLTLVLILIFSVFSFADGVYFGALSEEESFPEISASSYVLADAKTGEIIFSHNPAARMPIASVTKVMTALVVLENTKLEDVVTVMKEACGIEGSSVYLYEGEKLTVSDLLYAMMLESANDAATCLALYTAKSIDAFSDLMNEKAEEIGLVNTHFNNPHGLEDPQHYSTATDVALLWQEAMNNDDFRRIVGTKSHRIDLSEEDGYRFLSNHNKLLKSYENSIGGKTGFTKTAGRCLVSGAGKDGLELVMVTLNDPNDWEDHKNLFDYTFSLYSKVNVATVGSLSVDLAVVGGKEKSVSLSNIEPLTISVRDVSKISSRVEAPKFIYAPVLSKNTPLAKVVYFYDGNEIASVDLYPQTTVETPKKENFIKKILNFFK